MLHRLRHRRLAVWMTCCALLLAALAPSVTRAQAYVLGQLAPWTVVCSVMGQAMPAEPGEASHLANPGDHCQYCQWRGDGPALPPVAAQPTVLALLRHALPRLYWQAPRPLFAWHAAQPRGPPAQA